MPRTTLVLATLMLAGSLMASPIVATATPPHAGDPGPPDHAGAPADAGPPDHAQATEDEEVSAAPAEANEPTAADGTEPAERAAEANEATASERPAPEDKGDELVGTESAAGEIEPTARPEPVDPMPATSTSLPGSGTASPAATGTSSSTAPGPAGAVKLLGSFLAAGVLGVGLVARSRVPEEDAPPEADGEGPEPEPEADAEAEASSSSTGEALPTPGPVGLLTLGRRALDRGDVEAAADWFRTATLVDPSRQVAHFCLGLCLAELDRLAEAEAALAEARRLQSGDLEAAYAHAQVLARSGSTREALGTLERLADEMPGLAERLRGDEAWDLLHDHPRWLALTGELPEIDPPPGEPAP